jgi:hypothetical protein
MIPKFIQFWVGAGHDIWIYFEIQIDQSGGGRDDWNEGRSDSSHLMPNGMDSWVAYDQGRQQISLNQPEHQHTWRVCLLGLK